MVDILHITYVALQVIDYIPGFGGKDKVYKTKVNMSWKEKLAVQPKGTSMN